MNAEARKSIRLNELRELALRLDKQGKSSDHIIAELTQRCVNWGVSDTTMRNYLRTVGRQLS